MSLLSQVRGFARQHGLWQADTKMVAAVSGGSDSVALLLLLHELHRLGELRLDAVAHLNHAIRPDAHEDQAFCEALAERLQVPFISSRVDVPMLARRRRQSVEVAGRIARRSFLEATRRTLGADVVATAHTEDDQAETVLLRLLRGAGRRGAGGIRPMQGRVIRPLLTTTRAALRQQLDASGQTWCEDATNLDLANPRNRVRHELLPYLARHFNPSARRALARFADLARADEAWMSREAEAATIGIVRLQPGEVRVERDALNALPEALARRVAGNALEMSPARVAPSLHHVEAVRQMASRTRSTHVIPGLRMEHSDRYVVLIDQDEPRPVRQSFRYELAVPGEVTVSDASLVLIAHGPVPVGRAVEIAGKVTGSSERVQVAADGLRTPLVVRSRLPGDWLRPLGLGGRKKVQDVLVDRKVGRADRDLVPIVTDADGRIVWVAGHVIGEEFRVSGLTSAVITLELRRA